MSLLNPRMKMNNANENEQIRWMKIASDFERDHKKKKADFPHKEEKSAFTIIILLQMYRQ